MSYKNTFLAVCIISGFLTPNLVPIEAAVPVSVTLVTEDRLLLIEQLLVKVRALQAQLEVMLKKEVATIGAPTAADYTKGNTNARVQIVTYMDLDCPFCKLFHKTLDTIPEDLPEVSVTYRHFPIVELHPNAVKLAIAAECAGQIGGDAAFFSVVDDIFTSRKINATTNMEKVPSFIAKSGVAKSAHAKCVKSEAAGEAVEADRTEGENRGVQGTPQSYVYLDGEEVEEIQGAQPLSVVEDLVIELLNSPRNNDLIMI